MSEELTGNLLVAQSGGPTPVINASLAGVISEALNHPCVEEIYGSLNGVVGILNEAFVDLAEESQQVVRGLKTTPGAALGSCRYKMKSNEDFDRVLEVFQAHNIRYFMYIGGNDSQDTAAKISEKAQENGYDLRVIGIPKTIDNDLTVTDHCPGYASAVKYLCSTIQEMACDHEAMGNHDFVSIVEVMGRNAGWLAAGTSLAKGRNNPEAAPHLIYLPEVTFSKEKFVSDVQAVLEHQRHCFVVVSEGIVDESGNYVAADTTQSDDFGHSALGGAAQALKAMVEESLQVKARTCKLGYAQRAGATRASPTDIDEAFACGTFAIESAMAGQTGKMVTLMRQSTDPYVFENGLTDLSAVANEVKTVPAEWIGEDGASMAHPFIKYAFPLIQGESNVPHENGLPVFAKLAKHPVEKKLTGYVQA